MNNRTIYISRSCPHCKKLLIGIYKYDFLKSQFQIIDVSTQQYPDYIDTVPTLVIEKKMIKNEDVFGYMNNMVEQIFRQNPQLKEKYHPQQRQQQPQHQQQQQQPQHQQQPQQQSAQLPPPQRQLGGTQQTIGQQPQKMNGPNYDPVDDIVGWCVDDGCSFSPISETNDDCSKKKATLEDTRFSFINEENDQLSGSNTATKIPMENSNAQFQKSAKQQQMDESYERLMAERNLITR